MNSAPCPLCASWGFSEASFGLLCCKICGLIVNPAVWRPQANEAFEDEWFSDDYDPKISAWVSLFQRWNDRRTLKRLMLTNISGKRFLEIGVGSGSLLCYARTMGFEVMGCDLSKPICDRIQRRFDIRMHWGYVTELSKDSLFDVVVMNHVLEHVSDPVGFLLDVRNRLAPGGVLHIAVPNVACWEARLSGWTSYEPYHLVYFTPHTLRRTLQTAGFVIERLMTHESFSGWFLAGLRSVLAVGNTGANTRLAARKTRSGSMLLEHAYRAAMLGVGGVTWPLRRLQASLGCGDEAICIARGSSG